MVTLIIFMFCVSCITVVVGRAILSRGDSEASIEKAVEPQSKHFPMIAPLNADRATKRKSRQQTWQYFSDTWEQQLEEATGADVFRNQYYEGIQLRNRVKREYDEELSRMHYSTLYAGHYSIEDRRLLQERRDDRLKEVEPRMREVQKRYNELMQRPKSAPVPLRYTYQRNIPSRFMKTPALNA